MTGLAGLSLLAAAALPFGRSPAVAAATCDRSATPASFGSEVAAARPGQTVCLQTGGYGSWNGTNKAITITAAPGATPQMTINFGSGDNGFTLNGIGGMGGVISGGAANITIENSTFTDQLYIQGTTTNVVIDHNDFTYPAQSSSGGATSKIFLNTSGSSPGSAVTVENNAIENGDLDGVFVGDASGAQIVGNTFANLCDRGVNHTDNIQFDGGTQVRIAGNYVYEAQSCPTQGITSYDGGTSGLVIEDNVVDVPRDWGIELYADKGSVVRHNTVVWHAKSYSEFNTGTGRIDINRKSQDPAGSGTHVFDNLATSVDFNNGSTGSADHNVSGQQAKYVGPLSSWAGFKLSADSPVGLKAASDGRDDGARITTPASSPTPPPPTTPIPGGTPTSPSQPGRTRAGSRTPGLIASFGFGEAAGSRVEDHSGLGNNGTIHGARRTRSGRHRSALVFNGAGDYVSVPDSKSLDLRTGMTLEAWVRPAAAGRAWRSVIVKEQRRGLSYGLFTNDNRRRASAWVHTRADHGTHGGAGLPPGRWSYLAATYNGKVLRVYINGVLKTSRTVHGAISSGRGPLTIGGNHVLGEWFKGTIDDVSVWRTAVSARSIRRQMRIDASK